MDQTSHARGPPNADGPRDSTGLIGAALAAGLRRIGFFHHNRDDQGENERNRDGQARILRELQGLWLDAGFNAPPDTYAGPGDQDAAEDEHDAVHDGGRRADLIWLSNVRTEE